MSTVKAFHAPADAIAIRYEVVSSRSEFVASRAGIGAERNAGDSLPNGPFTPPPVRTAADLSRIDKNTFERSMPRRGLPASVT